MQGGKGLLIVDAGSGTIDISAYRRTSPHSQSYEEIAAPQCTLLMLFVILSLFNWFEQAISTDQFL